MKQMDGTSTSCKRPRRLRQRYLLVVWNDVEPEVVGPLANELQRTTKACEIRSDDAEKRHGMYALDVSAPRGIKLQNLQISIDCIKIPDDADEMSRV